MYSVRYAQSMVIPLMLLALIAIDFQKKKNGRLGEVSCTWVPKKDRVKCYNKKCRRSLCYFALRLLCLAIRIHMRTKPAAVDTAPPSTAGGA